MPADEHPNRRILEEIVTHLGDLVDEMVFLGGCVTNLLITDPAAARVRVTRDVDVLTEVVSYLAYQKLGDRLRDRGFHEDAESEVICRWRRDGLLLDVMPTDEHVFGFGNRWYADAAATARIFELTPDHTIRLISPIYFLATKLDAFDGRGEGDFLASQDIEDVIALVDGRHELIDDMIAADRPVALYIAERFATLLKTADFRAAISGHLPSDPASQQRSQIVVDRIRQMIDSVAD